MSTWVRPNSTKTGQNGNESNGSLTQVLPIAGSDDEAVQNNEKKKNEKDGDIRSWVFEFVNISDVSVFVCNSFLSWSSCCDLLYTTPMALTRLSLFVVVAAVVKDDVRLSFNCSLIPLADIPYTNVVRVRITCI